MKKLFFLFVAIATLSVTLTSCSKPADETPPVQKLKQQKNYKLISMPVTVISTGESSDIKNIISAQYWYVNNADIIGTLIVNTPGTPSENWLPSEIKPKGWTSGTEFDIEQNDANHIDLKFEFSKLFAGETGYQATRYPPSALINTGFLNSENDQYYDSDGNVFSRTNYSLNPTILNGKWEVETFLEGFKLSITVKDRGNTYLVEMLYSTDIE